MSMKRSPEITAVVRARVSVLGARVPEWLYYIGWLALAASHRSGLGLSRGTRHHQMREAWIRGGRMPVQSQLGII